MTDRAQTLLAKLTLEQKVGLLFHTSTSIGPIDQPSDTPWSSPTLKEMLDMHIRHFLVTGTISDAEVFAHWQNKVQEYATTHGSRLPVTFSTDPRHAYTVNPMMSNKAGVLSRWPESIGMVALMDQRRMEEYGDVMRQEYLALGIRACLHPQADLATEYRWSRIAGGLGEDASLAADLCASQIKGLQGHTFGAQSVAACVKHFPGGAPLDKGFDSHFQWGSKQLYPGHQFEYHLTPFRSAISAGVRYMMPGYGIPIGLGYPEVGMAFNKSITHDLLRGECQFKGIVLTDFGLITENEEGVALIGEVAQAKAWGVQHLGVEDRILALLEAGVDQFGGDHCVDALLNLVKQGRVNEARINHSALRILQDVVDLELLEHYMVVPENAARIVGSDLLRSIGYEAQKDSVTLVLNRIADNGQPTLPLSVGINVYTEGWSEPIPSSLARVVNSPKEADVAIIRLHSPYETIGEGLGAKFFHHGRLDFDQHILDHVAKLARHCSVIVDIAVDRPPILGDLVHSSSAIVINYGLDAQAMLDVLFSVDGSSPKGRLPFDLPRSMQAIDDSRTDVAYDTRDPIFFRGHGLRYL